MDLGSGQACGADRRSGSACGSDPKLGQAQGRYSGLGLDNCVDMHKYGDNLYEQSPSPLFSVFGRPLLSGGFSGLGSATENEDLEPLRVVAAANGSEWGLECSSVIIEAREELGEDGQRTKEAQNESSVA